MNGIKVYKRIEDGIVYRYSFRFLILVFNYWFICKNIVIFFLRGGNCNCQSQFQSQISDFVFKKYYNIFGCELMFSSWFWFLDLQTYTYI